MDYFILILVLYPFFPWHRRIGSAAVREASRTRIVGKVLLYFGQYVVAGSSRWLHNSRIFHPIRMISS